MRFKRPRYMPKKIWREIINKTIDNIYLTIGLPQPNRLSGERER